ncbi:MAG: hypothetical protein RLZZ42_1098, partial [Bacteroidota bacterium]
RDPWLIPDPLSKSQQMAADTLSFEARAD